MYPAQRLSEQVSSQTGHSVLCSLDMAASSLYFISHGDVSAWTLSVCLSVCGLSHQQGSPTALGTLLGAILRPQSQWDMGQTLSVGVGVHGDHVP